jgi:HSP20 family molecular chaperone IbpA
MSEQTLCTTENHQEASATEPRFPVFRPRVDLVDSGESVILWADLPGADENSVDITIEKDTLTLKAAVTPPEFAGMKPLLREYGEGHYERTFAISEEIDREGVEAVVRQGVLKLTLPKSKQAAMQKVAVKAG